MNYAQWGLALGLGCELGETRHHCPLGSFWLSAFSKLMGKKMGKLLETWERLVWKRGTSLTRTQVFLPMGCKTGCESYFRSDRHFPLSLHYERQTRLLGGQLAISVTIGNWLWQSAFGEVGSRSFKGSPGVPMCKFSLMTAGKIKWIWCSVITCSLNFIHLRIPVLSSGLISDLQRIFRGGWKNRRSKIISGPRRRLLPVRNF